MQSSEVNEVVASVENGIGDGGVVVDEQLLIGDVVSEPNVVFEKADEEMVEALDWQQVKIENLPKIRFFVLKVIKNLKVLSPNPKLITKTRFRCGA